MTRYLTDKRASSFGTLACLDETQRAEVLAREAVPPLFLKEALGVVREVQMGSVALPDDAKIIEMEP